MTYQAGQLVQVTGSFTTSSLLTTEVNAGVGITSLAVSSLAVAIAAGDVITLSDGIRSQEFTASGTAAAATTSIPVTTVNIPFGFAEGAQVNYPCDPTTVSLLYRPGKHAATVTLTYAGAQITKVAKGLYAANLDTTGLPGLWVGYWVSTGTGQATSSEFSFLVEGLPF